MSTLERHASVLASLTDKELEVLRLLSTGHTVKSIAAHLGRSEASINERLRDARRKTGIGSSRELARLVDDIQKNWDRKIDLPAGQAPDQTAGQARQTRPQLSKGTIIMLSIFTAAAIALTALATNSADEASTPPSAQPAAPRQSPLVGRWALDVARIPEAERPQSVTITFDLSPDGKWTTVVDLVQPDGTAQHARSTAAPDGVAVPVSGNMGFIDSGSLRQPAPNTLVMSLGKNGSPVSTRVYTVSKDRKTMTETIVWAGSAIPKLETTYFNRID